MTGDADVLASLRRAAGSRALGSAQPFPGAVRIPVHSRHHVPGEQAAEQFECVRRWCRSVQLVDLGHKGYTVAVDEDGPHLLRVAGAPGPEEFHALLGGVVVKLYRAEERVSPVVD